MSTHKQGGPQQEPKPPFPAQHQEKPGIEAELTPRPKYQAPCYKAAGKLTGKVALVTGGDGKRLATLVGGGMLVGYGLARRTPGGLVLALLGGALLYRGITHHSPGYPTMLETDSIAAAGPPADQRPTLGLPRNSGKDATAERRQQQQPAPPAQQDPVITASEDSFPASDPPAWTGSEVGSVR